MIVTRFAWIAQRLQSSKRWTRKSSVASWIASRLSAVYLKGSGETSLEISRTKRQNGAFRMRSSVLFWNFLISFNARVPGLYLRLLLSVVSSLTPSASSASVFRGFFPLRDCLPCNFRAIPPNKLLYCRYLQMMQRFLFQAGREITGTPGSRRAGN